MFRTFIFVILLSALCCDVAAQTLKLQSTSKDVSLPHTLLLEAVKRAGLDYVHPYENDPDMSNARILNDVKNGGLDIMWSMTTRQLEQDYQALYFPLYRGLLGMRVGIVTAEHKALFNNVRTLADLKQFVAGQGKTWPDTEILEANGLKVVKTLKYPNLFYMLEGGRFDYFPRGVHEPWDEIKRFAELNLVVEPHVLIRYRAPLYFFVNRNNVQLHDKLEQALSQMVADGTFNRLFFADPQVRAVLEKANLKQRVLIDIDNPLLTDKTPLDKPELWFDPLADDH